MITSYETRGAERPEGTITLNEIVQKYGIPYTTIHHWARNGTLKRVPSVGKMVLVSEESLIRHLASKGR